MNSHIAAANITTMIILLGIAGIFVVNTKTSRARAIRPIKVSTREIFLKNSIFTLAVFGIILIIYFPPPVFVLCFGCLDYSDRSDR